MQIFGQVWLWSLGSFLLGVLFTWLLLVRPARKRVVELEESAVRAPHTPTRVASPVPQEPNTQDKFLDDLFESQKPPQLPPPVLPPPPTLPPVAASGPTAPPEPPIPDERDTELSDAPFQQFTESTTVFMPPNLPAPPEVVPTGEDWFSKEGEPDPHSITDVEDDEAVDDSGTIFTQHTTPIPAEVIRSLDSQQPEPVEQHFEPEPPFQPEEPAAQHYESEPTQRYEPEPARHFEPQPAYQPSQHLESEPTQHLEEPEPTQHFAAQQAYQAAQRGQHLEPEPTDHFEPERAHQPAQHFEPEPAQHFEPEPTQHLEPQPVYQTAQRLDPGYQQQSAYQSLESDPGATRSLFEPVVPVGEREDPAPDDFVPPGPFGPGSAMPLPGGGAPAPEFNVKASVTALRYCTQDNPQFDRIVAEVWFRTPSDAERVGFRVLS